MVDVFTKKKRSEVMSRILARDNKETEEALVKLFRRNRITGWRRHLPLFGRPDFTFRKQRIVVFVDGCFWHCCPEHSNRPVNNRLFWERKLEANRRRDHLVTRTLYAQGWCVIRLWEHELVRRNEKACLNKIRRALTVDSR